MMVPYLEGEDITRRKAIMRGKEIRTIRKSEAEARAEARAARSDAEQLGVLMDRGHGHCREAQRLAERIAAAQEK